LDCSKALTLNYCIHSYRAGRQGSTCLRPFLFDRLQFLPVRSLRDLMANTDLSARGYILGALKTANVSSGVRLLLIGQGESARASLPRAVVPAPE